MRLFLCYVEGGNRYHNKPKVSEARLRHLLKVFALNLTASDAVRLIGINTRLVKAIDLKTRQRSAEYCEAQLAYSEEVELNEPYFGPKRIRGKRDRGGGSRTIVFGVFK